MNRSLYKGFFIDSGLYKKIKSEKNTYKPIRTRSRRSTILPILIGKVMEIYNGKKYSRINISEEMVGHKLGEFVPTRIQPNHNNKKKDSKR